MLGAFTAKHLRCHSLLRGPSAWLAPAAAGRSAWWYQAPLSRWQAHDDPLSMGDVPFRRTISREGLSVQAIENALQFSRVNLLIDHDLQGAAQIVPACSRALPNRLECSDSAHALAHRIAGAVPVALLRTRQHRHVSQR